MNCGFYLQFRTNIDTNAYKFYEYNNIHNHFLETYDNSTAITEEIQDKIEFLKSTNADVSTITDIINQDFKVNFHWRTIYYQLKKIKEIEYGKPSKESEKLAELLEKDSETRGGFCRLERNKENELLRFCCMTKRMIKIANTFNDVIIIDATHKSNRFNMPLLDIVVINNMGKTSTCFFSLLNNQTYESFHWALEQFKGKLEQSPAIIFSDEEEALTQGYLETYICD